MGDAHGAIELIYKFHNYRLFDGALQMCIECMCVDIVDVVVVSCAPPVCTAAQSNNNNNHQQLQHKQEKKQIF